MTATQFLTILALIAGSLITFYVVLRITINATNISHDVHEINQTLKGIDQRLAHRSQAQQADVVAALLES